MRKSFEKEIKSNALCLLILSRYTIYEFLKIIKIRISNYNIEQKF